MLSFVWIKDRVIHKLWFNSWQFTSTNFTLATYSLHLHSGTSLLNHHSTSFQNFAATSVIYWMRNLQRHSSQLHSFNFMPKLLVSVPDQIFFTDCRDYLLRSNLYSSSYDPNRQSIINPLLFLLQRLS